MKLVTTFRDDVMQVIRNSPSVLPEEKAAMLMSIIEVLVPGYLKTKIDIANAEILQENKKLHDCLRPVPEMRDTAPCIVYFANAKDRLEFIQAIQAAMPSATCHAVEDRS